MVKNEALNIQYGKTVAKLREVLDRIETAGDNRDVFRDSAIQRFEIAFDVCWKMLKERLRVEHGIECASPKACFREAFAQGIVENDEAWILMTDMRNETSHAYNEEFADSVLLRLPQACEAFEKLLWKLKK